jgi:hypothetical protein
VARLRAAIFWFSVLKKTAAAAEAARDSKRMDEHAIYRMLIPFLSRSKEKECEFLIDKVLFFLHSLQSKNYSRRKQMYWLITRG